VHGSTESAVDIVCVCVCVCLSVCLSVCLLSVCVCVGSTESAVDIVQGAKEDEDKEVVLVSDGGVEDAWR